MLDKWIIDIETKNTFSDVGGQANLLKLDISLIGIYSYLKNEYIAFEEKDFPQFEKELKSVGAFIGFATDTFDLPIIKNKFIHSFPNKFLSFDILAEVVRQRGHRVKLDSLAKENINIQKSGSGLDAIKYYQEGRIEELKKYCLQDVKVTRDLFEFGIENSSLIIPSNYSAPAKLDLTSWKNIDEQLKSLEKEILATPEQKSLF